MATYIKLRSFESDTEGVKAKIRDFSGSGEHAQITQQDWAASLTRAEVASATSSTTLAVAGSATLRRGLRVYNNSSAALYVKEGADCTNTDFDFIIGAGEEWVMDGPIWTGIVTGVWASVNGNAKVTERF